MKTLPAILVSVFGISFCFTTASADVAYSNFGPGDSFYTQTGRVVGGAVYFSANTLAAEFQSQVTGKITSIEMAVALASAPIRSGEVNVMLYVSDPLTNLPHDRRILSRDHLGAGERFRRNIHTGELGLLAAGLKYWFVLQPATFTTLVVWDFTTLPGNYYQGLWRNWNLCFIPDDFEGASCGAYRINVDPVSAVQFQNRKIDLH